MNARFLLPLAAPALAPTAQHKPHAADLSDDRLEAVARLHGGRLDLANNEPGLAATIVIPRVGA